MIKRLLALWRAPRIALSWRRLEKRNRGSTTGEIFSDYWETNYWANKESKSGDGSSLAYTARIRKEIPLLLTKLNVTSIFDAPCGDFHWFKEIDLGGIEYVGGDIVESMISELGRKFASPKRSFIALNLLQDKLPASDVWICRDLIFHLPTSDAMRILRSFARSEIKYLLITSHTDPLIPNRDTFMGGFRLINLRRPPFSLPEPVEAIDDYIEGFPPRKLMLFERSQMKHLAGMDEEIK